MTEPISSSGPGADDVPASAAAAAPARQRGAVAGSMLAAIVVLAVALAAVGWLAWHADRRVQTVEQELVRRLQENGEHATEARMLAKQAEDSARETAARVALLDARVAEVAVQRGQLEDLIQSLSRSRDENLLVDIDSAIRVALQQSAITGSAEPLVAALKQSDERLAHHEEPRLEGVRRAIARDLDRVKTASVADIGTLGIKLDEAVRMVDDLPLLSVPEARVKEGARSVPTPAGKVSGAASTVASADAPASGPAAALRRWWSEHVESDWEGLGTRVWSEARSLVRVTRIEHPESMLIAPDQAYFLRENLKLRLLNARLALLSRQFDTAQADLQVARAALDRYFDRSAKRTMVAADLIKQVSSQARQVGVPRPDDTLAALAAASGGR